MKHKKIIILSSFTIIILLIGIVFYLLLPSPAEKFLIKDNHGRTYVSFVEDMGITSYKHYSNDRFTFLNDEADLLNPSLGYIVIAFSKNKQIFQNDSFVDTGEKNLSTYSKTKKWFKSDLDRFITLNNLNKMHGVNNSGNTKGAMDETIGKYRYKISSRNSIVISGKKLNNNDTWENKTIKLTDIKENKNGSWSLLASRPDKNNKIVKTHLILFPQTVK